ncbi:hypothetical protein EDF57_10647 [Novosphingobium sp. PhB55]|uniref:GNAT family N-acetyltransferase n=1 Tax=Novosphingobium sp. PhB55 TaxID=2485106 RepID=UPI0010650A49|nr:N-acetyltransferase [Novosphingobium sp. PhB55]TDW63092.1 hypothetical protein EDF57_10647 [Novosphingobium sp. PhB55]
MLEIVSRDQPRLVAWAQAVIGCRFFPDAQAIGWGDERRLRAVLVYDCWTEADVHIHLASDGTGRFGSRSFLAAAYHFPFVTAGKRRLTGLVPASNAAALRLNLHMGFVREGVMRRAGDDGEDIIILGMLREECRFIPREHRGA